MTSYNLINKLSSSLFITNKSVILNRYNAALLQGQSCNYAKSAEQKLGIEKPKRPMTPFLKFVSQMRPALVQKNPKAPTTEIIKLASKHWQQLDSEVKGKMSKEYEKDVEDYKKIKEIYESSLTPAQKDQISKVKAEMLEAKEKKKLRAELKELGKPKRPKSSYMLFCAAQMGTFKELGIIEFSKQMQVKWANLPASEKSKYEQEAKKLMDKYKQDLAKWEEKMIAMGNIEYVKIKKTDISLKSKSKKDQL